MPDASAAIDSAIFEIMRARALVSKIKTTQVRNVDVVATLRSTAHAWFGTHRAAILSGVPTVVLSNIDEWYTMVLNSTSRSAARTTYLDALLNAKAGLIKIRKEVLIAPPRSYAQNSDNLAPDFSSLAGNLEMQEILTRRWDECRRCVDAGAHLAAIVMMGGLLEALFVARANKMLDKSPLIAAGSAPKDNATGKTRNYQDWMLDSYIKVAHELNWISNSARDIADVLKDYRNYIHPEKELRHGVKLTLNDSSMFWSVTMALTRQLLVSAATR